MNILNKAFLSIVLTKYQNYCVGQQVVPSMDNFLEYLLKHNLLQESTIRHYVVLNEFEKSQREGKFATKTQTVNDIASVFGLHPNSIWNILKDHKAKFEPNA